MGWTRRRRQRRDAGTGAVVPHVRLRFRKEVTVATEISTEETTLGAAPGRRHGVPAVLELAEALPMKSKLGSVLAYSEAVWKNSRMSASFGQIATFCEPKNIL